MRSFYVILGFVFFAPMIAQAQAPAPEAKPAAVQPAAQAAQPAAPVASFEVVESKLCASVDDRACTGERNTFAQGEKAWLWLNLKPNGDTTMRIRWTVPGDTWTMDAVPVRLGRTWYYKTLNLPGAWTAELLDPSDKVVYTAQFTATPSEQGAAAPAAAPAAAAAAKPAPDAANAAAAPSAAPAAPGASTHVNVVELQLAQDVKMPERDPVNPGTTFTVGSKVYAWMKLDVKDVDSLIKVKWYRGDELSWTSGPLSVKQSPEWRTWVYKTVDAAGTWKAEVVDSDDKPVQSTTFTVQ